MCRPRRAPLLVLSACGDGGSIDDETAANESKAAESGDCGEVNMAVNPWVGYEADAYVVGAVAEQEFGCTMNYKDLKEDVSWQGFGTGEVDIVIEDWGHPDLEKKFFAEEGDGSATDVGPTGDVGIIGWFVPPWLAEEHPDILDYKNLNNYAKDFATSESGGKGQFLGADPSYVQFDEAIVSNLGLDFQVVFSGSEAASITAFQKAEENKEFLIGYFYEPQWLFADIAARAGGAAAVHRRLPGRPGQGRLRLPGDRPPEDRLDLVARGGRRRRSDLVKNFTGPTTTRTWSPSTSPRTACPPRTPRPSGSTRTPTRSTPGSAAEPPAVAPLDDRCRSDPPTG